jgi:hypothetical protein
MASEPAESGFGEQVRAIGLTGFRLTGVETCVPPPVTVRVALAADRVVLAESVARNCPVAVPALMWTVAGTVTAVLLLDTGRSIGTGIAVLSVTVHVTDDVGDEPHASEDTAVGTSGIGVRTTDPFRDAVIWTVALEAKLPAVAVNDAVAAPADIVIVAGSVTVEALPLSATATPAAGAGVVNPTVHLVLSVGNRYDAAQLRVETTGCDDTVIVVVFATPAAVAVMVGVALPVVRFPEEVLKTAELDPAVIVTEAGTASIAELLASATKRLAWVGLVSVTVHDVALFAGIDEGLHVMPDSAATGGFSVKVLFTERPFHEAEIWTVVLAVTVAAVTEKLASVAPAGTLTDNGVVRAALFSVTSTDAPPAGAACVRVTVHIEVPGDMTDAGEQLSALSEGWVTTTVTAPPVAVAGKPVPAADAAMDPVIAIGTDATETAAANCTFTVATTPFAIVVALMPASKQIVEPGFAWQYTVFPAVVAVGPAVMAMLAMSDAA